MFSTNSTSGTATSNAFRTREFKFKKSSTHNALRK
jgi:hypothetical protein